MTRRVSSSDPESGIASLGPELDDLVSMALREDVGEGDWTTRWTVDPGTRVEALVVAREDFVVAGGRVARMVFLAVDPSLEVDSLVSDGSSVQAGASILRVRGEGQGILTGERTALNFLARLSGIATLTRRFVDEVEGLHARITDTRKTTPGWRRLEKWAVRVGGGVNHRMGLDDMILVKDNHIAAAGSVRAAISRVRDQNRVGLPVGVELTKAEQLEDLRDVGVDRILLDNMGDLEIRGIVTRVSEWPSPRPELEASGNMTLDRVRSVAATGVEWISVGALTHSAKSADLSLRVLTYSGQSGPEADASLDPS